MGNQEGAEGERQEERVDDMRVDSEKHRRRNGKTGGETKGWRERKGRQEEYRGETGGISTAETAREEKTGEKTGE